MTEAEQENQKQRELLFRFNDLEDPVIQVLMTMDVEAMLNGLVESDDTE